MRKLVVATSAVVLSIAGITGVVGVADAYPPSTPPTSEVGVQPPLPTTTTIRRGLPETGGDVNDSLVFGASAAALGAGLILITRRRRRAGEV